MINNRLALRRYIIEQSKYAVEFQQINSRLRQLLPQQLQRLVRKYRERGIPTAKATRMALTDAEYLQHVEQTVEMGARAKTARLQQETHTMFHAALLHHQRWRQ